MEQTDEGSRKSDECSRIRQFDLNELNSELDLDEVTENGLAGNENAVVQYVSTSNLVPPPEVGMIFDSWEEIDNFYKSYGKQEGFGVARAAGSYKAGSKQRRNMLWTCEAYGRSERPGRAKAKVTVTDSVVDEEPSLDPGNSRKCECPVSLFASINKDGQWVVRRAVNEHKNHTPLTPRKTRCIHMYRKDNLTNRVRRQLLNDSAVGIPLSQIHSSLVEQHGGVEELGLSERDLRNCLAEEKRLKMEEGDVEAMLDYFKRMSADNQNFFHMHRSDKEGRMQDILWVDARSRVAYQDFGDVVCFDATYITNKYHLPFANFVGVNHHGQSILLGCALVSHETTETYEWVFSTWKMCMADKAPNAILTDQAPAMRRALLNVMPESTHRWCLWHITSKFCNKLKHYARYDEFVVVLTNIIYDSLSEAEFDSRWWCFIEEYALGSDEWLSGLFEERHMWAPPYMKHLFWAGMKTTQRVESINSFFDKYINKDTRLYEFAGSYCRAMEARADSELQEDAKSIRCVRKLAIGTPIERCFQKYYTDAKFKETQRELTRLCVVGWRKKEMVTEHISEHTIQDRVWIKLKNSNKEIHTEERRYYKVRFDCRNNDVSCDCKYFDSHGIICRHMFCVYDYEEVTVVPDKYILRRWRKDVQRRHSRVKVAYHDPGKTAEVRRFNKFLAACEEVCFKASLHEQNIEIVAEMLQMLTMRIDESNARLKGCTEGNGVGLHSSCDNGGFILSETPSNSKRQRVVSPAQGSCPHPASQSDVGPPVGTETAVPKALKVKDPPIPKRKGRPRIKRLVSEAEKAAVKAKKKKEKEAIAKNKKQGGEGQANNNTRTRRSNKGSTDGGLGGLPVIGEDTSYEGNMQGSNTWISSPLQPSREVGGLSYYHFQPSVAISSSDHCTSAMLGNDVTRRLTFDHSRPLAGPLDYGTRSETLLPLQHEISSTRFQGNGVNLDLSI